MCKNVFIALVVVGLLAAPSAPARSQEAAPGATAEIEIRLPAGYEGRVVVAPTSSRVVLELPPGATYPQDFEAATGGLVEAGPVQPLESGLLRLELQLMRGVLDRVELVPDRVVLYFASRFASSLYDAGEDPYRLGPDDRIAITVYDHDELNTELTISKLGVISAPLIGEVNVAGLTVGQLEARLADLLGEYLVSPQVAVLVREFNSQWVMVAGEVRKPGRFSLTGGTRLKEVLTEAEGFSDTAGEWITISRRAGGSGNIVVGRSEFEQGVTDPLLEHGDIVTVGRARYCYVQGEVNNPGRIELERGMTLLRAISVAGGLTDWGSQREVRVIREGEEGPGKTYNLKKILRGKAEDPPLSGGEVVYVGRRVF